MSKGRPVFAQIMSRIHLETFQRCVRRYSSNYARWEFSCWDYFLCIAFAQMTYRTSLRDTVDCLEVRNDILYHLGFRGPTRRSTLADANERRDWRIFAALAESLIRKARRLYQADPLDIDLDAAAYALDSTTIVLCLSLFPWARFRRTKAAIKLHTLLDLRGPFRRSYRSRRAASPACPEEAFSLFLTPPARLRYPCLPRKRSFRPVSAGVCSRRLKSEVKIIVWRNFNMSKSYLITKTGQITKWIARQPLLIDEASLQKLFPNLPSDEAEREKFFSEKRDVLDQMFDAVASYFDEGDPLETHEDPKGEASPDWEKAEATLDDGESYRYFCQPFPIDLDLLRDIAEAENCEMPPEIADRVKSS